MSWTDDRVELLKKLWSEGLSASQIAGRLGSVTRNAVIGKVHRLGLSGRATTSRVKSHRPRKRIATAVKRTARARFPTNGNPTVRELYATGEPYVAPVEEMDIPQAQRKTVETLEICSCRWPVGDPQTQDFYFCGGKAVPGLPYCEHHARRAFQAPAPKRRERENADTVRAAMAKVEAESKAPVSEPSDA